MPHLDFLHSGRRGAALTLAVAVLMGLVACAAGRSPEATSADPAKAYTDAREAAAKQLDKLKAYDLAGTIAVESRPVAGGESTRNELTFAAAARWPDRLMVTQSAPEEVLSLGTGKEKSWFRYAPMRASYVGAPVKLRRDLAAAARMELDEEHIFNFYGGLGQLLLPDDRVPVEASVAETLRIGDRDVPCRVFSFPALDRDPANPGPTPGAGRWWLDPGTGICLKVENSATLQGRGGEVVQTVTFTVTRFEVGNAPADDAFVFTPPEGERVAATLDQLANPDSMTGQVAPDAVLTGLDGTSFKLSDLRGKVVFLDLWATWCGPCRMEMPHLEALHKELGKDEVVFVAASSEDKPVIEAFLQKNPYTMRIAQISAEDAQNKFKASSIPTGLVIDKDGVIRAHMVGAQNEEQLRRALGRAGVGR